MATHDRCPTCILAFGLLIAAIAAGIVLMIVWVIQTFP